MKALAELCSEFTTICNLGLAQNKIVISHNGKEYIPEIEIKDEKVIIKKGKEYIPEKR